MNFNDSVRENINPNISVPRNSYNKINKLEYPSVSSFSTHITDQRNQKFHNISDDTKLSEKERKMEEKINNMLQIQQCKEISINFIEHQGRKSLPAFKLNNSLNNTSTLKNYLP